MPTGQGTSAAARAGQKVPKVHLVHWLLLELPQLPRAQQAEAPPLLKVSAGQAALPEVSQRVSVGQVLQVRLSGGSANSPSAQQAAAEAAKRPAGHAAQARAPELLLTVPAGQGLQFGSPAGASIGWLEGGSGRKLPGAQAVQAEAFPLGLESSVPPGQAEQEKVREGTTPPQLPAGQQWVLPGTL